MRNVLRQQLAVC